MSSHDSLSSRTSDTMDESKQFLLRDEAGPSVLDLRKRNRRTCLNKTVTVTTLNLLLLVSALAVWSHVHVLLRKFDCDPDKRQDDFEPDCKIYLFLEGKGHASVFCLLTTRNLVLFDTPVTFQPHYYYGGEPGKKTDEMWQRLSPPGDGIVEVPNEFTVHLPASLPAPNHPATHKVYGVSMFHQLHCLNFLRFAYYPETVEDMLADEIVAHRDHCLDYIRQAIMCAGDSTFEPLTMVGINGMGATHQCRNFDRIFSWAYDHRSDKINGSGYTDGTITHTPGHRNSFGDGMEDDADADTGAGEHHHH